MQDVRQQSLSRRQAEIANLVVAGKSSREIAERLCLSPRTVEHHLEAIFNKLGVGSRVELVTALLRPGLPEFAHPAVSALQSVDAIPNNLPRKLTSFIGREAEIAEITSLVGLHQLITLVGSGGVGKTRTSLAVAEGVFGAFPDGVWFVELAPLSRGDYIPGTVAQALGLTLAVDDDPVANLARALKSKQLLLVFDNCEHLVDEVAKVAALVLNDCHKVKILATSRERLRVRGEATYRMPSLSVPPAVGSGPLSIATALAYVSVALFVERARAVDHRFTLTDENAPVVADICRRLDGIPLAIELAAARVNILTVRALATKLDQHFLRVLKGRDRMTLPRHQTMHCLIDWSYDLLAPTEQRLFERLSVFSGGFTFEAAAAIHSDDAGDEFGVFALLTSLIEKSLVVAELQEHPDPRYRLLESSRQYSSEKLTARGEVHIVARRHALAYLDLAERLERDYYGIPLSEWTTQAKAELENWRTALAWMLGARQNVVEGQRLVTTLHRVWVQFAYAEGRHWVRAALERLDEGTPPNVAAELELLEASFACDLSEITVALAAAERALRKYKQDGLALGIARAQKMVGRALVLIGRSAEGEPELYEALKTARTLGNDPLIGSILECIALSRSMNGDISGARSHFAEALAIYNALGDNGAAATAALNMAEAEFVAGEVESAVRYATDALAISRALNDLPTVTNLLSNVAAYLIASGRYEDAWNFALETLQLAYDLQLEVHVTWAIQHCAAVVALQQREFENACEQYRGAAHLLGFVDKRLAVLNIAGWYTEEQEYNRVLAVLRDTIATDELTKLMATGAAMTQDQAVEYALSMNDHLRIAESQRTN